MTVVDIGMWASNDSYLKRPTCFKWWDSFGYIFSHRDICTAHFNQFHAI